MSAKILGLALLFGAAGGAVASFATVSLFGPPGEAPSEAGPSLRSPETVAQAGEDVVLDQAATTPAPPTLAGHPEASDSETAALEARIETLEARIQGLRDTIAKLEPQKPRVDFSALSVDELKARSSSLYLYKNYEGTLEASEALLAKNPDLEAEERSQILSRMAQCHRALGDPKKADAVYRQVEDLHGAGTAGAMTARYQRAWLRFGDGDIEGAREFMREVARTETSPTFWKLFSRVNALDFSIRLDDTAHVRSDLEAFKAELADDDSSTGVRVKNYIQQLLDKLDS